MNINFFNTFLGKENMKNILVIICVLFLSACTPKQILYGSVGGLLGAFPLFGFGMGVALGINAGEDDSAAKH